MKLRYSTLAFAILPASTTAWSNVGVIYKRSRSFFPNDSASRTSVMTSGGSIVAASSSVALRAETLEMPTKAEPTVSSADENVVAEGSIVSSFPGGLLAVRLEDDYVAMTDSENDDDGDKEGNSSTIGTNTQYMHLHLQQR